jgi:hypothetical protein
LALFYAEMRPLNIERIERHEQIAEMANTGQLGDNSLLYVILRKGAEQSPLRYPSRAITRGRPFGRAKLLLSQELPTTQRLGGSLALPASVIPYDK